MRLHLRDLCCVALAFSLINPSSLWAQDLTISSTSNLLTRFADGVADYSPATAAALSLAVSDPTAALGGPNSDSTGAPDFTPLGLVSLGDAPVGATAGSITLTFAQAVNNSLGERIAIFENAGFFFAELGFVEVSSDGANFARFPNESLTTNPDDAIDLPTDLDIGFGRDFGTLPSRNLVSGFAGADPANVGTIFDLTDLAGDSLVTSGLVDLDDIGFVRIVDVPGDGRFSDSCGYPFFDAFGPGNSTGGFDLDAIGVVSVPEPRTATTLLMLMVSATCLRTRKSC